MAVAVLSLLSCIFAAIVVSCLGFVLFSVAYLYYIHKINDHLPGPPRSSFIFGHLPDIWKYQAATGRTKLEFLLKIRLEYGPIFVLHFLHISVMFLADATYLQHVFINNYKILRKDYFYEKGGFVYGERGAGRGLVTNTNEESWFKHRQIMNRAFHRGSLKEFVGSFNHVSDLFLTRMDAVVDGGQPTSMLREFRKAAMEAICQVSFNIKIHAIEDPNSHFPTAVRDYMNGLEDNINIPLSRTLLGIFQFKIFQNAAKRKQIAATRFLRMFASDCIETRRKDIADGKAVPEDLLSILIKDGSLSMVDIIDEFVTIFLAGHETTASSLSFALYEIISNPHVEEKLLNELDNVLAGREYVEFDDLANLKYLGQVFEETLRKHPVTSVAPAMVVTEDITIGGYFVPKGNSIHSSPLLFGMNPEIWKDPEVFEPERFSSRENISNFSTTHFPFSFGPHNCIGQIFAKFEMKVVLANLLQKFQFKLLPGQTDRKLDTFTSAPRDGVMCEVSRRE